MRKPVPFGKYCLLDRISVGGMAEVFKARVFGAEGFAKTVAIKRILPNMAEDDEFITMFIDEAKIAVQLNHANICQIYELGKVYASHYIVMEYIAGKDLLQLNNFFKRRREWMPLEMAAYVMAQVCEGLDYAHRKRDHNFQELHLVHRDISPQNVLISYGGEVKIIDFGIAKAATRSTKTQVGVLKGKFGYMSPEQVRGIALDRRSDIFAAGTTLCEILTAQRLFVAETDFATLEKVRKVDIPRPSEMRADIPPELERIITKALAREREERYQWASEFGEDLQRFLVGRPTNWTALTMSEWMHQTFTSDIDAEKRREEEWVHIRSPEDLQEPEAEVQGEDGASEADPEGEATVIYAQSEEQATALQEDAAPPAGADPASRHFTDPDPDMEEVTDFGDDEEPTEAVAAISDEMFAAMMSGGEATPASAALPPTPSAPAQPAAPQTPSQPSVPAQTATPSTPFSAPALGDMPGAAKQPAGKFSAPTMNLSADDLEMMLEEGELSDLESAPTPSLPEPESPRDTQTEEVAPDPFGPTPQPPPPDTPPPPTSKPTVDVFAGTVSPGDHVAPIPGPASLPADPLPPTGPVPPVSELAPPYSPEPLPPPSTQPLPPAPAPAPPQPVATPFPEPSGPVPQAPPPAAPPPMEPSDAFASPPGGHFSEQLTGPSFIGQTPQRGILREVLIGVVVAVAILGGGLAAWWFLSGDDVEVPPPEPGSAVLLVETTPEEGAEVWVDGKLVGTGGQVVVQGLTPGARKLRVKAPGHKTHEVTLALPDGEVARHVVELEPGEDPAGRVRLAITPDKARARVSLDGARPKRYDPKGPDAWFSFLAGEKHVLRVSARGFFTSTHEVVLEADEDRELSVALEELRGTIRLTSVPSKATVKIDDKKVGRTPWERTGLDARRSYFLIVSKRSFEDWTDEVKFTSDRPTYEREAELVPKGKGKAKEADKEVGFVVVSAGSSTFAKVFVDGKDTQRLTPVSKSRPIELPPGTYTLGVKLGGKSAEEDVTVRAGEFKRVRLRLK